jgi:hypothetical protein
VETGWSIRSPAWSRRAANFTGGWRVYRDHLGHRLAGFCDDEGCASRLVPAAQTNTLKQSGFGAPLDGWADCVPWEVVHEQIGKDRYHG